MPKTKLIERKKGSFTFNAVDFVLRALLTFNLHIQLAIYFVIVLVVSLSSEWQSPAPSYFSDKRNIFNQYFVKVGWGWTLASVSLLLVITHVVQQSVLRAQSLLQLIRLLTLTFYWYICTHSFEWLENLTGSCDKLSLGSKRECMREEGRWEGFDISGHCFLLSLSLTVINEESQVLHNISKILDRAADIETKVSQKTTPVSLLSTNYHRLYVRLVMVLLVCLNLLWLVMLFVTAMYFHSVPQKVLGMVIAGLGWWLVYKVLNPLCNRMLT